MRYLLLFVLAIKLGAATTNYYVAPSFGTNTPAGAAPGTSITNAFKYLSTVLNTYAGPGDTIFISPESPVFECFNLSKAFASGPVHIVGDIKNVSGFTNASGVLVPRGPVIWSNKTNGWTLAGAVDDTFDMAGYSNITMTALYVHNQSGGRAVKANQSSRKFYATNCTFASSGSYAVDFAHGSTTDDGFYIVTENCQFICLWTTSNGFSLLWNGVGSTDWDMQVLTKNCLFFSTGSYAAGGFKSGGTAGVPGGWLSTNDIYWGDEGFTTGGMSTNNIRTYIVNGLIGGSSSIQNTGQVTSLRSAWVGPLMTGLNLTDSAERIYTNNLAAMLLNFGHSKRVGLSDGNWFRPLSFNPLKGLGGTNTLSVDLYNKYRASTNTIGPLEPVFNKYIAQ